MKKKCKKCQTEYENPQEHFYRKKVMKDGLSPYCKTCDRKLADKHRKDTTKRVLYNKKWMHKRDPEKHKARYTLNNAIKLGKVMKPEVCQHCGTGGLIHGHHENYQEPLNVMWLCRPCHFNIHNGGLK